MGIIIAATAVEFCVVGALFGAFGVLGRWNGWLDLFAQFAPVWLVFAVVGAALAWPSLSAGPERRAVLVFAAVGFLTAGILMLPEYLRDTHGASPAKPGAALRVLTFNVWEDNIDPDGAVQAIISSRADIVALQEVGGLDDAERQKLMAAYPFWTSCKPHSCDVILLSKTAWATSDFLVASADGGLTAVWGRTKAPDGEAVEILTTHYRWPVPPAGQRAQRSRLATFLKTFDKTNLIVTGDFNLAPWSAALKTQDAAFGPLVRRTRGVFTWPATIARFNVRTPFPLLPIDQIYAGPAWRTKAIMRLPRAGSDHYGVLAILERGAS